MHIKGGLAGLAEAKEFMVEARQTLQAVHGIGEQYFAMTRPRPMAGMGDATSDASDVDWGITPDATPVPAGGPYQIPTPTPAPAGMTAAQIQSAAQPSVWGSLINATEELPSTIGNAAVATGNAVSSVTTAVANALPTVWTIAVLGIAAYMFIEMSKATKD
jgi:hypothetical protein